MKRIPILAALVVALAAPMARAQATGGAAPVNDGLFAQAATAGGLAELSLSELGMQKATDSELKKFSQTMIDDHSKMNQELATLAAQRRVALPRQLDLGAQFFVQVLSGESRERFDRCYAKAQLHCHEAALAAYEAEAERGQDVNVKAFASKAIPHIKEHLSTIRPLCEKLNKGHEDKDSKSDKDRDKK
jgi:putative membrane protein